MLYDSINSLMGYRLIETNVLTKKVQARTHKKKRINKKWMKRYGFKEVPDYGRVVVANGCILAHPKTIEKIKDAVDKRYIESVSVIK